MTSKVYFAPARVTKWRHGDSMPGKLERLMGHMELSERYDKGEWAAIKTHFGSEGAHRIVRPVFLRIIADSLKAVGAKPIVTDTVRIMGLDYLEIANKNGINHLSVGAPVVLADGIHGNDNIMVKAGPILNEIAMASMIHDIPAMIVVSHVKGHINAGYAGAIKNMAMGGVSASHRSCGWKCGRGAMHSIGFGKLIWDAQKCVLCSQCEDVCPLDCIKFIEGREFSYNDDKCWRCGRCTRVCPEAALTHEGADDLTFMRALVEAAAAVISTFKRGKIVYVNFLTEIQPECDCMPAADVPAFQDLGIMASDDITAIEQASMDMVEKCGPLPMSAIEGIKLNEGESAFYSMHKKPYRIQTEEAERLGLGSRQYELVEI